MAVVPSVHVVLFMAGMDSLSFGTGLHAWCVCMAAGSRHSSYLLCEGTHGCMKDRSSHMTLLPVPPRSLQCSVLIAPVLSAFCGSSSQQQGPVVDCCCPGTVQHNNMFNSAYRPCSSADSAPPSPDKLGIAPIADLLAATLSALPYTLHCQHVYNTGSIRQ
jgi:hypothetical protein